MSELLSRKFIYAMVVLIMGFVLVILNKLTAEAFVNLASVIGGVYVIGNVATKLVYKNGQQQDT